MTGTFPTMDGGLRQVMDHLAKLLDEEVDDMEDVMSAAARVEAARRVAAAKRVLKGEQREAAAG